MEDWNINAKMQKQRLLPAGNSPNSNTRSILVCIQHTPASLHGEPPQAVRQISPRCQDEKGWRGTICLPHPHPPRPGQDRAHNPHTPFSPPDFPWQQQQTSLLVKVNRRLSTLLTANQRQEYKKRTEDFSIVDQEIAGFEKEGQWFSKDLY